MLPVVPARTREADFADFLECRGDPACKNRAEPSSNGSVGVVPDSGSTREEIFKNPRIVSSERSATKCNFATFSSNSFGRR